MPNNFKPSCAFFITSVRVLRGQGPREGRLELSVRAAVHHVDDAPVLKDIWTGFLGAGQSGGGGSVGSVELSADNTNITRAVTVEVIERDRAPFESHLSPSETSRQTRTFHLPDDVITVERALGFALLETKTGMTAQVRVLVRAGKILEGPDTDVPDFEQPVTTLPSGS